MLLVRDRLVKEVSPGAQDEEGRSSGQESVLKVKSFSILAFGQAFLVNTSNNFIL